MNAVDAAAPSETRQTAQRWAEALDAFEQALRDHAAVAAGVLPPSGVVAFRWPSDLGPLPAALRARAEALLRTSLGIERQHEAALASLRGRQRLLNTHPDRARPSSPRLDVKG